jgi:hypothetical protein
VFIGCSRVIIILIVSVHGASKQIVKFYFDRVNSDPFLATSARVDASEYDLTFGAAPNSATLYVSLFARCFGSASAGPNVLDTHDFIPRSRMPVIDGLRAIVLWRLHFYGPMNPPPTVPHIT